VSFCEVCCENEKNADQAYKHQRLLNEKKESGSDYSGDRTSPEWKSQTENQEEKEMCHELREKCLKVFACNQSTKA